VKELIPVSIVPQPPVVVGLDGTEASAAALTWAVAEAAAHHAPLVVVHVLDPRCSTAVYSRTGADAPGEQDDASVRVKELIDRADVGPVEQVFEIGVPGRVLVRFTREARLLVLGHAADHRRAGPEDRDRTERAPAWPVPSARSSWCPSRWPTGRPRSPKSPNTAPRCAAAGPSTRSRAASPWPTTEGRQS
jgi:nucleotide-binding universal stress UspA family protein